MLEKNLEEELKNSKEQPAADLSDRELDVFISYSSLNKNVADAVVSDFEQHGIRCWYAPRDIMPGQEWVTAIHDAINSCKLFILIYTDSSNESRQVANEVALAFNSGKTLIPFRLSETEMSTELEYYLTRVHWLDAVKPPLMQSIESLREYSDRILNGEGAKEAQDHNVNSLKNRNKTLTFERILIAALFIVLCITIFFVIIRDKNKNKGSEDITSVVEPKTDNDTDMGEKPTVTDSISDPAEVTSEPDAPSENTDNSAVEFYKLAYQYQMNEEGTDNLDLAYEYYMKTGDTATDNETISDAMYKLGYKFFNGEGVKQDFEKGINLCKKAIDSGNTSAMNMMGNIYLRGEGEMEEDYKEAEKYYKMAADLGDENGQKNLEFLYENGYIEK